jgi:hypothetical protein
MDPRTEGIRHVAHKSNEEQTKSNQKTAKKHMLHDHITHAYEPMVGSRYNRTPVGPNSRLTQTVPCSKPHGTGQTSVLRKRKQRKQVRQEWVDGQQTRCR